MKSPLKVPLAAQAEGLEAVLYSLDGRAPATFNGHVGAAADGHPGTCVRSQKHALGAWLQDFSKENQQLPLISFADSLRQGPCVPFCLKGLQHVSVFFVSILL